MKEELDEWKPSIVVTWEMGPVFNFDICKSNVLMEYEKEKEIIFYNSKTWRVISGGNSSKIKT